MTPEYLKQQQEQKQTDYDLAMDDLVIKYREIQAKFFEEIEMINNRFESFINNTEPPKVTPVASDPNEISVSPLCAQYA